MKIMHLLQSSHFSGAENVVCQIFSMFKNESDIEMVYVSRPGTIENALMERNIKFYPINKLNIKSVKKAIKDNEPDVIHAHDVSASIIATLASIGTGCKVISHMHVNNDNMGRVNLKTLLYAMSSSKYNHIFWVSSSCYDNYRFKRRVVRKSTILNNVMIRDEILNKRDLDHSSYTYDVVYVGRLSYQKNPERLINVIASVHKQIPELKVAIVGGNGELVNQTKEMVRNLELEKSVELIGFMNNPLKLMSDSKLMLMTSRYEGLPMCVLEAMALGVPVVSTPVDGLLDVIKNGENGFLSEVDDELVAYIVRMVKDDRLRQDMSKRTIEIFEEKNDIITYKSEIKDAYLA